MLRFTFLRFDHGLAASLYRVVFLTGSALNVLSVEDGKIPTKKVKVGVKTSHILCGIPLLSLFC